MATASKTWQTASDWGAWTATKGNPSTTSSVPTANGQGGSSDGFAQMATSGKNKASSNYWTLSGTWESIFGVPAGSTVTSILISGDGYYYECTAYNTGSGDSSGPIELRDGSGNLLLTLVASTSVTGTKAWTAVAPGTLNQAVPSAQQASGSSIQLRVNSVTSTGNSNSGACTLGQDALKVTITYTAPSPVAATINGQAGSSLTLKGSGSLQATATGAAGATPTLKATGRLTATVTGAAGATLVLTGSGKLAATAAGAAGVSANLAAKTGGAIAATVSGTSTLQATLKGSGAAHAVIAGIAGSTLTAKGTGRLAGTLTASASGSGTLKGQGSLRATVAGGGGVQAAIAGKAALAARANGSAGTSLRLAGVVVLGATASGRAGVSAHLSASGKLAAVMAGSSLLLLKNSAWTGPWEYTGYRVHFHFHGCGPRPLHVGTSAGGTAVEAKPPSFAVPSFWPYHRPTVGERLRTWVRGKLGRMPGVVA